MFLKYFLIFRRMKYLISQNRTLVQGKQNLALKFVFKLKMFPKETFGRFLQMICFFFQPQKRFVVHQLCYSCH